MKLEIFKTIEGIDKAKVEAFIERVFNYGNKRLYASVIQRMLDIDIGDTYKVIDILDKHRVIKRYYEISEIDYYDKKKYERLIDIPNVVFNEDIGEEVDVSSEMIIVFYEVLIDVA